MRLLERGDLLDRAFIVGIVLKGPDRRCERQPVQLVGQPHRVRQVQCAQLVQPVYRSAQAQPTAGSNR